MGLREIAPSEITLGSKLEEGMFGVLHNARLRGKSVTAQAIKGNFDEFYLGPIRQQISELSKISHPNLTIPCGMKTTKEEILICAEEVTQNLHDFIISGRPYHSLLQTLRIARDVASAMLCLHSLNKPILHRALKTKNIFINAEQSVKVGNFGLAHLLGMECGKYDLWTAPELSSVSQCTTKSDIYSFGFVLWQVTTQEELPSEIADNIGDALSKCQSFMHPKIPDTFPKALRSLIQSCWDASPEMRPEFSLIVNMLDAIILQTAVPDPHFAEFWKTHFNNRDTVPWEDFINAMCNELGLLPGFFQITQAHHVHPDTVFQISCIQEMLETQNAVVSMEDFGLRLPLFGDFRIDIFAEIYDMCMSPWFHGAITTQQSQERLVARPDGTFLVRFSTTQSKSFVVSLIKNTEIRHYRIRRENNAFVLHGNYYPSIQSVINEQGKTMNLRYPCAGSPFAGLYNAPAINAQYNNTITVVRSYLHA